MKTIHIFLIFISLALVQLFIPYQMIAGKEAVLKEGKKYKFKTRPVDPTDPFRGKYITLRYQETSIKTKDSTWNRGDDVYVKLKDSLGYATIDKISKNEFANSDNYVKAKVNWYNLTSGKLNFDYEFDRYYMDENKAYEAEITSMSVLRDSIPENDTYAVVYVKNGKAVLADVMIDEVSIKDYVKEE
ncbi:GDYXXLXY domain-containing protein [Pseudofulvibacter geojedonensis]|uniref:GDYXXLXY domain-containing protein n=1 Tax=Pseudofulvibacter geojedonensis TaxID=1123758 RepID=A0ABW3I4M2_9FLAO